MLLLVNRYFIMSDNESDPEIVQEEPEPAPETVTKPKKKWEFTPARQAALEKAHKKRSEKAAEKKKLKIETEKKALEIIEDRRLQTTADDDKLDHVIYELDKLKKHMKHTVKDDDIPEKLKPPPLRRSRKKAPPPPDTESELTESDYVTTETESLPPPRRKRSQVVERSEDYQPPKINVVFG